MYFCLYNSFGQFNTFIKNFQKCSLPFITNASTFDIYSSENPYIISEKDFITFLMMENDTFMNDKNYSLKNDYHKYMAVGKFTIYNNFIGLLYYRNIAGIEMTVSKLELMLCVLDKKGKLISSVPISGANMQEDIEFYSTIHSEDNIEMLYSTKNKEGKKYFFITKEGLIVEKE
jgi:hypothetical protein